MNHVRSAPAQLDKGHSNAQVSPGCDRGPVARGHGAVLFPRLADAECGERRRAAWNPIYEQPPIVAPWLSAPPPAGASSRGQLQDTGGARRPESVGIEMPDLTPEAHQTLAATAQRHGVSTGAALAVLQALASGGGTMAQFNHPELGGAGQWSRGGMTMVGDMFNQGLKHRVDALCSELASQMPRLGDARIWNRRPCWRLVAGGPRHARVQRRAERFPLRPLSGCPTAGHPAEWPADPLRHGRP